MASKITVGYKKMLEDASASVRKLEPADAIALAEDPNIVLVDLRDPRELAREGKIPGAFHCPRGMLEFWIDPESPYAKSVFQEDKTFVFYSHQAGARRFLRRPHRIWGWRLSHILVAGSRPGARRAVRPRRSSRSPEPHPG